MARSLGWQPGVGTKVKCRWTIQVQGCGAVTQAPVTWGSSGGGLRLREPRGLSEVWVGRASWGNVGVSLGRAAKQDMLPF